jgi:hypothetical protein
MRWPFKLVRIRWSVELDWAHLLDGLSEILPTSLVSIPLGANLLDGFVLILKPTSMDLLTS